MNAAGDDFKRTQYKCNKRICGGGSDGLVIFAAAAAAVGDDHVSSHRTGYTKLPCITRPSMPYFYSIVVVQRS